jgi:hypothetical protein
MPTADAALKIQETSQRLGAEQVAADHYRGVDLAPSTLESLVTWDVSGHAQRERDRLNAGAIPGG